MYPRKVLFLVLILFLSCSKGSYKVIEKSGKRPAWINGAETNYIITSSTANLIEEAKNQCLQNIRDQIISGVAINVRSKTEINIEQRNGITDEKFKTSIISQSANLPSLQGISLSKASDFYWEKVIDKDKKTIYGYHVKFPFPKSELNRLLEEYDKINSETDRMIEYCIKGIDTATSFSTIENIIGQLNLLEANLIDYRKDVVQSAITNLNAHIQAFNLVPLKNIPGKLTFVIKNKNKAIKIYYKPDFKSNCGSMTSFGSIDTLNHIIYSFDLSKYTDNPKGIITYNLAERILKYEFAIDVNANKIEASINNDINFKKISDSSNVIKQSVCEFILNSKYDYPFEIKRIDFKYQNNPPVVSDNLKILIDKKGTKNITFSINQNLNKLIYSSANKAFPYLSGNIYYKNINTGTESIIKFSDQRFTTDW